MNVTSKLKMDMSNPNLSLSINAVQGDAYSRTLCLALYNGLQPWHIPENAIAAVRYAKPDYTVGYYDTMPDGSCAWTAQENILTIRLAPQMLTAAGTVRVQIELIQGIHILSTFALTVYVEANPAVGVLNSENYINWLQWLREQSEEQVQQIQQSVAEVSEAVQTATQASQTAVLAANDSERLARQVAEAAAIVEQNKSYTRQESDRLYSPMILSTAAGSALSLPDSLGHSLRSLTLYGKTTQNGTPTPEIPIALVSAGHNGSLCVTLEQADAGAEAQQLILTTPMVLPGIPVSANGNYTDETGQQWICDEVDFVRGIYVQRVGKAEFNGSEAEQWTKSSTNQSNKFRYLSMYIGNLIKPPANNNQIIHALSTAFSAVSTVTSGTYGCKEGISVNIDGTIFCYSNQYNTSDPTAWKNYLSQHPMTVLYERAIPLEIPLSAEELAVYHALHTYDPGTVVRSNAGIGMKVCYYADTKRYIDSRISSHNALAI